MIAAHVENRSSGWGVIFRHGDAGVTPYKVRDVDRCLWCHTRVQGFGVGGQLSNSVYLNLKSGEISPYWTGSANTLVPGQLPAPLDSATYEIGQCADGDGKQSWTVPATKLDSAPAGLGRATLGGQTGPGDGGRAAHGSCWG